MQEKNEEILSLNEYGNDMQRSLVCCHNIYEYIHIVSVGRCVADDILRSYEELCWVELHLPPPPPY